MSKENKTINQESMAIRTAKEQDIPTLRDLFEKSRLEGQTRENDTGADLDHLIEGYFECKDSCFWVAEIDDIIVGMIGVQRIDNDAAEMRRLRVRDEFRRNGIGTRLMEHAIAFCKEREFLKVVLDVRIERVSAISMFDTFGFLHGREREVKGRKLRDFYLDLYTDTSDTRID